MTLAKPDAMKAGVAERHRQEHPGGSVQLRLGRTGSRWASRSTSVRTSTSPAGGRGQAADHRRRQEGHLRDPGAGSRGSGSPVRRREEQLPRPSEILNVNGKDMPSVESTITAKLQQDPSIDTVLTLGCTVRADRGPVGQERRQQGQSRHLRHQRRTGPGHQERRRAVGRRPATVPAGLPGHRLAVALPQQRKRHRRRPADVDRARVHRQDRTSTPSPNTRKSWAPADEYPNRPRILRTHKVVHDERVKEQNRLQRLLIRPEMGALVGAVGDLHLLHHRGPAVPEPGGPGDGAVRKFDDRHHGRRASGC